MTIGNTYYCMLKLRTAITLEMINYQSLISDIAQPFIQYMYYSFVCNINLQCIVLVYYIRLNIIVLSFIAIYLV